MLPTGEQEIFGEAEDIRKDPFMSLALLANSLIGRVNQLQDGVKLAEEVLVEASLPAASDWEC
ncbi:MAG: hypothetical protein KME27_17340 [Lyngbya sp. HA4199-MV5]|jgi:hypothetical protein|nr:hypothetical protein [Lyngbya sp. HA4199-MV5]